MSGELPGSQKAYIVFNSQIFPINKTRVKLGRKLDNDLVIQESSISRYHAEIRFEENQYVLYDLDSTGGTFLNNKQVNHGVLFAGDIILLCNVPLMFMAEGASIKTQSDIKTGTLEEDSEDLF
ncbi:FHA domain-containing protein [Chloroflexota bacterium]